MPTAWYSAFWVSDSVSNRLDEKAQGEWLDKIYADDRIRFWKTAVNMLDVDCALIQQYAEKIYDDGNISYFSTLTKNHT